MTVTSFHSSLSTNFKNACGCYSGPGYSGWPTKTLTGTETSGKVNKWAQILHCQTPSQLKSSFMPLLIHGSPCPICPAVASTAKFPAIQKTTAASAAQARWFLEKPSMLCERETVGFSSSGAFSVYKKTWSVCKNLILARRKELAFIKHLLFPHWIPARALRSWIPCYVKRRRDLPGLDEAPSKKVTVRVSQKTSGWARG